MGFRIFRVKRFEFPFDCLLIFCLVIVIYLIINLVLPFLFSDYIATYFLQPLLWLSLTLFIYCFMAKCKGLSKARRRSTLVKLALGLAFFQIYLKLVAGALDKFSKNPNSFTPTGVLINVIFVSTWLIGTETSRAWLTNRLARKPSTIIPVLIALFYTMFELPLNQIPSLDDIEGITKFLGSSLLPLSMENLLITFLAMWGGVVPALVYHGIIEAFEWFSPLLPNLNWAMKALTGTVIPLAGITILQEYYAHKLSNKIKKSRRASRGLFSWSILGICAVIMLWFTFGVFPIFPTVIFSGSMSPGIQVGDIVITAKVNHDLLKVGDIVNYRTKDMDVPIVHRIIEERQEEGKKFFITKGDANSLPDKDPVDPRQVNGKVIFVIPRIGWVSIFIKNVLAAMG